MLFICKQLAFLHSLANNVHSHNTKSLYNGLLVVTSCITLIFYKQPVYKQIALGWKNGLNPLSLSNNKNHRLKKIGFLPL